MKFYFIDYMMVLSLVILFWGVKITKPIKRVDEDYLSVQNCNAMRGYFALIPLLVHIANVSHYSSFTGWFSIYGNAVVSGFFFFTGFGLMKQYIIRPDYDKGFLVKRLPKVLVPYIAATLIYWVADFFILGFLYSPRDILHAIACGDPIVLYSWFIIHNLFFYLAFYLLMKICKKQYLLMVLGSVLYYILTTALFMYRGFGEYWYQTSIALPIGVAYALYEKEIYKLVSKYYYLVAGIMFALTVLVYFKGLGPIGRLFPDKLYAPRVVLFALMMLCIIALMMKLRFGNKVLYFLGGISFEIYLLHGIVIMFAKSVEFLVNNDFLFGLFVIIVTVLGAVIFKGAVDLFFKLWDCVMNKKGIKNK